MSQADQYNEKEEKLFVNQFFCATKVIEDKGVEEEGVEGRNTEYVEKIFNPQVLFTMLYAAYTGIDNLDIYGMIRAEMHTLLKDCVQTQGCASFTVFSDMNWYCINF